VGFDLSQDGKSFAIPADGPAFDVISLATGEATRYGFTMDNRDPFSVKRVSFSPDGTVAVVNVWRRNDWHAEAIVGVGLKGGNNLYELSAGGEPVYSSDGKRMLLYNLRGNLGTYVVANGQPWGDLSTGFSTDTGDGGEVSYSHSHAQFWTGMEPPGYKIGVLYQGDYRNEETGVWRWADSQLLIYDTRNDEMIQSLLHLPPLILGLSFSPDGETFVLATQDGDLSLWDTASAVPSRSVTAYDVNTEPQISPDGRRVAYSYHSSARIFSPFGELQQVITPIHGTLDLEVRFVDANQLALFYLSISGDYVEIWDLHKEEIAYIAPYVLGPCDFTADGHTMICHQPSTRFMDTRTGEKLMDVGEASYGRYAFSPDDRYIAYCGTDWQSISLFKRSTGKYLGRLIADAPTVCGNLAFSPDSSRLASAAGFVWNVSSQRLAFAFGAHAEDASWMPLAYGPQGDVFFVGGDVFDAATGNKLANLPLYGQALYFSADGTRLIAVSGREWSIWTTH
jgi:WD40 repeat protein